MFTMAHESQETSYESDHFRQFAGHPSDLRIVCVARLELFGSAARDDFDHGKSDFDFIVKFPDYGSGISGRFFGLTDVLQELLSRPVDMMSARKVSNPYFLDEVEADRTTLYGPEDRSVAT